MKFFIFSLFLGLIMGDEAKYQAALIIDGQKFCSGAAISESFIITSAQCVYDAYEVDVLLSSSNLTYPGFASLSTEIIIHPDYNPGQNFNNLALIKLPREFTGEKAQIKNEEPKKKLDLSGWQRLTGSRLVLGELLTEKVEKLEDFWHLHSCHEVDDNSYRLFCVYPGNSTDLGAPLVYNNTLHGIISENRNNFKIATNVRHYSSWINEIIYKK